MILSQLLKFNTCARCRDGSSHTFRHNLKRETLYQQTAYLPTQQSTYQPNQQLYHPYSSPDVASVLVLSNTTMGLAIKDTDMSFAHRIHGNSKERSFCKSSIVQMTFLELEHRQHYDHLLVYSTHGHESSIWTPLLLSRII